MSARGRPRKTREDNPGASGAKSPCGTRKKSAQRNEDQIGVKKTTDTKVSSHSKLQESQKVCTPEQQTPKPTKSGEKKAAPRSAARRGNNINENPSKDLQSAPENEKKSQNVESAKTPDSKESCPAKPQESQVVRPKKFSRGANSSEERQAPRSAKGFENPNKELLVVLEKLKVKKIQKSESSKCVNEIENKITEYLKRHLDWGKDICVLKTGSYYENLKVCDI